MAEKKAKTGLSTTQIILIVGIALALMVIAGVGYLVVTKQTAQPEAPKTELRAGGGAVVITEENKDQKPEPVGTFTTKMSANWTFPTAYSPAVDAIVANDKSNSRPFFFEVILPDTNELVYTSPKIPVGSELKELVLDVPLKAGTYNALCQYNLLNEDGTIASSLSFGVVLTISS